MLARFAFAVVVAVSAPSLAQQREPLKPRWITDPTNGCRLWSSDDRPNVAVTWSGSCSSQLAQGHGVATWTQNGNPLIKCEGEWREGKMQGQGYCASVGGDRYEGGYRDGKFDGRGALVLADGTRIEGEFRNGDLDGRGTWTYKNGSRYEGQYRNSQRNGQGIYTTANGSKYEGSWQDGKPNGYGKGTANDGQVYEGNWTNGCFQQGDRRWALFATEKDCGFK
jgi:hypothetical protein